MRKNKSEGVEVPAGGGELQCKVPLLRTPNKLLIQYRSGWAQVGAGSPPLPGADTAAGTPAKQ